MYILRGDEYLKKCWSDTPLDQLKCLDEWSAFLLHVHGASESKGSVWINQNWCELKK